MSNAWSQGSTAAWRRTRAMVLTRDGQRCQLRLEGCTTRATCVHHTVGKAVSGDDPAHLVAACQNCNLKVGDPARYDPPAQPRTAWLAMYILHQLGVEPVTCPHAARVRFEGETGKVIYRCSLPDGHPGQHADRFSRTRFTWDTPESPLLVKAGDL